MLWWWPQTYAKTESLLTLARGAGAMSGLPARPRILDAGAGSAPAAMALLDALAGSALAVDASEAALAEARGLSGGLVETLGTRVSQGRAFDERDHAMQAQPA